MAREKKRKNNEALERKNIYLANGVNQNQQVNLNSIFSLKRKSLNLKIQKKYGPGGAFFMLSKKCFKIDWSEFTFEVCPFHKAIQSKRHSTVWLSEFKKKIIFALKKFNI